MSFSLTPLLIAEIVRIGLDRTPNEACGILLPPPGDTFRFRSHHKQVIELPNRSHTPRDSYEIWGSDIVQDLIDWLDNVNDPAKNDMVIWHTHPSGSVGPSRGDLDNKIGDFTYLVVSIDPSTHEAQTTLF
jgi:proteasome lid subunit RPN8/RPN11